MWPPKPNELEMRPPAAVGVQRPRLARHVVQVESVVGLLPADVGGTTSRCSASSVATASTAPAAPSRCPIEDFSEDTGTLAGARRRARS